MKASRIGRRRFLQYLPAGMALAIPSLVDATPPARENRAAAIQMTPKPDDLEAKLIQAEQLVEEAIARGVEWKDAWIRRLPRGRDYYDMVTCPYLKTGELREYVPAYLRD